MLSNKSKLEADDCEPRAGIKWGTQTLLAKPDAPRHLRRSRSERTFWVATDRATYRNLVGTAGLAAHEFEAWLRDLYRNMLDR